MISTCELARDHSRHLPRQVGEGGVMHVAETADRTSLLRVIDPHTVLRRDCEYHPVRKRECADAFRRARCRLPQLNNLLLAHL